MMERSDFPISQPFKKVGGNALFYRKEPRHKERSQSGDKSSFTLGSNFLSRVFLCPATPVRIASKSYDHTFCDLAQNGI